MAQMMGTRARDKGIGVESRVVESGMEVKRENEENEGGTRK